MTRGQFAGAMTGLCFILAPGAWADVYKMTDSAGRVVFTDVYQGEGCQLIIREPVPQPPGQAKPAAPGVSVETADSWKLYAQKFADLQDVDPFLVRAVIQVESGGNPEAISPKGAMGLMQLMPGTARELGVEDPMHPHQNVKGGITYLSQMIKRFSGDLKLALAAYNAGPAAVEKYRGIPPYEETRAFVDRVLKIYRSAKYMADRS